jgi:hypothetical protein
MAYRVTVTQVGSEAAAQGGGDVFDLADVLHVGARHSLQSGLVAPLDQVSSPLHICCAELRAHREGPVQAHVLDAQEVLARACAMWS